MEGVAGRRKGGGGGGGKEKAKEGEEQGGTSATNDLIHVYITSLNFPRLRLAVNKTSTVAQLKKKIARKYNLHNKLLRLIHGGKPLLNNYARLEHCGLRDGVFLHLAVSEATAGSSSLSPPSSAASSSSSGSSSASMPSSFSSPFGSLSSPSSSSSSLPSSPSNSLQEIGDGDFSDVEIDIENSPEVPHLSIPVYTNINSGNNNSRRNRTAGAERGRGRRGGAANRNDGGNAPSTESLAITIEEDQTEEAEAEAIQEPDAILWSNNDLFYGILLGFVFSLTALLFVVWEKSSLSLRMRVGVVAGLGCNLMFALLYTFLMAKPHHQT
ncbi:PA14 domain-containing protein [Balamuthia mandrillaris]